MTIWIYIKNLPYVVAGVWGKVKFHGLFHLGENQELLIEWLCVDMTEMKNVWYFSYFHLLHLFSNQSYCRTRVTDLLLWRSRKRFSSEYITNSSYYFILYLLFLFSAISCFQLSSAVSLGELLWAGVVISSSCLLKTKCTCQRLSSFFSYQSHMVPCFRFVNKPVLWLLLISKCRAARFSFSCSAICLSEPSGVAKKNWTQLGQLTYIDQWNISHHIMPCSAIKLKGNFWVWPCRHNAHDS